MAILNWQEQSNIENSLFEFLQDKVSLDNTEVINDKGQAVPINIRIGQTFNDDISLPVVSFYQEGKLSPRSFVGSNRRIKSYLVIIDIRAWNDRQRQDLADWVEILINDGFPYYEYTPSLDPENPSKVLSGLASIDFVTNTPVRLGDNVDLFEKYRHRISISVQIEGGN